MAKSHLDVVAKVAGIPDKFKFNGMDFGFETSYNALVRMAVDDEKKVPRNSRKGGDVAA